ncbi:hypothetical protein CLOM_g7942 [Closterium sp. NIES-68]|nr:hypothetical protein CLOM_g7942 [Closterium sp. NIES-68]
MNRPLPHPEAAQLNEDTTGYDFSPRADTSLADLDSRLYRFCKTATGGAGLSRADIKELLSIVIQAIEAPGRVSLRSMADFDRFEEERTSEADLEKFIVKNLRKGGDLKDVNLYYRSSMSCVRGLYQNPANREGFVAKPVELPEGAKIIYKGPETGSWWRELQRKLPVGGSVAAVIMYSDETTLTTDGGVCGWPVYISLGNISSGNRWRSHGHRLCALLPEIDKQTFAKGEESRRRHEVFQESLSLILEEQKKVLKAGGEYMIDPWGIKRWVHPATYAYVGDYPEQCKVAGTKSGVSTAFPCPKCTVPNTELSNMLHPIRYRTEVEQLGFVQEILGTQGKTARSDVEVKHSTHGVHCALWGFEHNGEPFGNPYRSLMVDLMHMSSLGVYKHILGCLKQRLSNEVLAKLDSDLANVTAFSRQSFFRLPAHTDGYFSGNTTFHAFQHQAVMQVLPVLLMRQNVSLEIVNTVELFCTWHAMAWHRTYHTENTLRDLEKITQKLVPLLVENFKDEQSSEFNIPKIHAMLHVADDIRRGGIPVHYCSDLYEHIHIALVKRPYRASNKRNAEASITRRCLITELIDSMTATEDGVEDKEARTVAMKQALESGSPAVTGRYMKLDYTERRNTTWKAYAEACPGEFRCLADSIQAYQQQQQHPHGARVKWETVLDLHKGVALPPDDDFTRYSKYPAYARAAPTFHGRPWFSDVTIDGVDDNGDSTVWPAKLLLIFTLHRTVTTTRRDRNTGADVSREQHYADQVAFVRYYRQFPGSRKTALTPMQWWPGGRGYGIVSVESLLRVIHVVPYESRVPIATERFFWNEFKW